MDINKNNIIYDILLIMLLIGTFGFQDPASEWMYGIIELHDKIIFYLILILITVFWFFFSSLTQKDHLRYLHTWFFN
jgi:heme/copper-type cytochrome/quinol oxidase subunit 2